MHKYWAEQEVFEAGRRSLSGKKRAPSKKLLTYLTEFQHDKLTTGTTSRPPSFTVQRERLVGEMQQKYLEQGYRQLIIGQAVNVPNLLEVLLIMHHITHEIELTDNFGYAPREVATGVYTARNIPHAEFTIIGNELKKEIEQASKPQKAASTARVFMQGRAVCVEYQGRLYTIARLRESSTQYQFMQYLLTPDNHDIDITIQDINSIPGCASVKNLTEPVRYCGFDKELKSAFFPVIRKERLRFTPAANLTTEQYISLQKQGNKIVNPS
jgi:hypothetical protein